MCVCYLVKFVSQELELQKCLRQFYNKITFLFLGATRTKRRNDESNWCWTCCTLFYLFFFCSSTQFSRWISITKKSTWSKNKTPQHKTDINTWSEIDKTFSTSKTLDWLRSMFITSAVVDTTFVDINVDTKNIPTCRYNIQHIDKRTMEK